MSPTLLALASCLVARAAASWTMMDVGGREVHAFVPKCVSSSSPVVVSLHAWASNAKMQMGIDGFAKLAESDCAVLLYPQGKIGCELFGRVGWSWNAGGCCPNANKEGVDDVAFIDAALSAAAAKFGASNESVFVAGISNGGMMANRVACQLPRIKAMVSVSGPLVNGSDPASKVGEAYSCPRKNLPILHFHGTGDEIIAYHGCNKTFGPTVCQDMLHLGWVAPLPDVPGYIAGWRARNGLSSGDASVGFERGEVTCTSWGPGATNVTLCTIEGEGHAWPGNCPPVVSAMPWFKCTHDIDASKHAWDFLRRYFPGTSILV